MKLWQYVTDALKRRIRKVEKQVSETQDKIDALTARVRALKTTTDALVVKLKALIDAPGDITTEDLAAAVTEFENDIAGQSPTDPGPV